MRVNELREQIKTYSTEDLRMIIAEMYKAIPKKIKEEKQIDRVIRDPNFFKKERKEKTKSVPDMDLLKGEIETFIDDANNDYYFAPNQIIPKKERSKWRFKVKRYYKDLISAYQIAENQKDAAQCMENLYKLLCKANGVYLFVSAEPFEAIGVPQVDFLRQTLLMKQGIEEPLTWVQNSLRLVLENDNDSYLFKSDLAEEFVALLKTAPQTEIAIEEAKKMKQQAEKKKPVSKGRRYFNTKRFDFEEKMNEYVETIFLCYIRLHEWDEAVTYFKENYIKENKEVKLHILLKWLFQYERVDDWVKEYELALKSGIQPRRGLQKMYKYIKENCRFPEYIDYSL